MAVNDNGEATVVAVLTLKKHAEGIWITKLLLELEKIASPPYEFQIVALESLDASFFGADSMPTSWRAIVNRVSDAANPIQVKACQAVLTAATIWGLPVYNGPRCYSIGCNKFLHHQIFYRAGMQTPRSVMVRFFVEGKDGVENKDVTIVDKLLSASTLLENRGCQWPFLIKPNSAGFGSGIALLYNQEELTRYGRRVLSDNAFAPSNDGLALLQEYIQPKDSSIFRVWFLDGNVQCATKRSVDSETTADTISHAFTKGCASSVGASCQLSNQVDSSKNVKSQTSLSQNFTKGCLSGSECSLKKTSQPSDEACRNGEIESVSRARFTAWKIPLDVKNEIENLLLHVGSECQAGSVEFLYNSFGERLYFDLNMLSTLPTTNDGSVENAGVWPDEYNPWVELAESIERFILGGHSGNTLDAC